MQITSLQTSKPDTSLCAHMHTHIHTHAHTHPHTHTHTHTHKLAHACTHVHIHTCQTVNSNQTKEFPTEITICLKFVWKRPEKL